MDDSRGCRHCGLPVPGGRRRAGSEYCCFGCRFAYGLALPSAEPLSAGESPAAPSTLLLRIGLGVFLTLNIMVASWVSYSQEFFGIEAQAQGPDAVLPALFSYLALFLCTLLVTTLGLPLISGGRSGFRRPGSQMLVFLGVFAAYALSAVHTVRGEGSLYYDTAAVVLVIVTLGSYLEAGAKRRAATSATRGLASLPRVVQVRRVDGATEIPVDQVRTGDVVRVRPGETVAVDATVVEGTGHIEESSLTGESRPRVVAPGDRLLAGCLSLDGQLWLRADGVGGETILALMERSLADARKSRPEVQRLADRLAAVFVPGVVLVATLVLLRHTSQGRFAEGLLDALAVLLISCPCALGLAAPLACWHGLRRAAEHGILIDSAPTLEAAAKVDALCFDKTGTLTEPELALERITATSDCDKRRALAWAAGLESASLHPIGRAVVTYAMSLGVDVPVPRCARAYPGMGIEGRIAGHHLRLGGLHWVQRLGLVADPLARDNEDETLSTLFLMNEHRLLARFDLAERLRPGAAAAIDRLRRLKIEVQVLSGDRKGPTQRLADRLGIAARGRLLPEDKVKNLASIRASGKPVAMVGDGLNDALVLASADVGISLGSASDLACRSGNVRLLSDRLDHVPLLFEIARDVHRRIRANLLWAFAFNSIGIALAAAGWLTPIFAALAMVLSSLTVVHVSSRAGESASQDPLRQDQNRRKRIRDRPPVAEPALGLEP